MSRHDETVLPLTGVRVLDVATAVAGPTAATLLGDFGADVIKVEEPGSGDGLMRAGRSGPGGRSLYWIQESRNKRSLTLNLRRPEGQDLLRRLTGEVDIVITNYRPSTLERWGIGPDALAAANPSAIILFVSGFGLTGPNRDLGGFDRIASAFSGLTYVTGSPDRPSARPGFSISDYMTAYLGAFGVMTALYERDRNGSGGQVVDLALYEAPFRASEQALLDFAVTGAVRERTGTVNPNFVPAADCVCRDGVPVSFHAGTDALFRRLADEIGRSDLAEDAKFATLADRVRNREALLAVLEAWIADHDSDDIVARFRAAGIPVSKVMSMAEIAKDEHYRERGTIVEVDDPHFGRVPMVAPLPHFSRTPGRIRTLGPAIGEHSRDVLQGLLGLSDDVIDDLVAKRVVDEPST